LLPLWPISPVPSVPVLVIDGVFNAVLTVMLAAKAFCTGDPLVARSAVLKFITSLTVMLLAYTWLTAAFAFAPIETVPFVKIEPDVPLPK